MILHKQGVLPIVYEPSPVILMLLAPNIKIDNRQQQKVIVKVNTKVDTVTKNVIVNNVVTAPSQGKQPPFLDTAQLCQLAGDTQCVAKQNQFETMNLVTRLDSTGKAW